ncbi:MAG: hypothetical protein NTW29_16555 [Bacteroidetes bacterium]|nr:hypothetical protein [Bacteroidota bacterium]
MSQIELTAFIPQSANYQIWYPKSFLLDEAEDGVVSITLPETNANLALSTFTSGQMVTEQILTDFFQNFTEKYTPLSELKSISSDGRIWLEREFENDKAFWIWWAISASNKIVLASVNSEEELSSEDRHLFTFMMDKMEIYPDEDDE